MRASRSMVSASALVGCVLVLVLTAGQCGASVREALVARAGADQAVAVGDMVKLDGSASTSAGGGELTFEWTFESVPEGSAAELIDADMAVSSFVADVAGAYVVVLVVSDGDASASDLVTVVAANAAPELVDIDDQVTLLGTPIDVVVRILDEDPDSVTLEARSGSQLLVADGDIEVLGAGADRTLRIVPAPLRVGTAEIGVLVRDSEGLEGGGSFELEVVRPFASQSQKLTASDGSEQRHFGFSAAVDEDFAVVGSYGGGAPGSAYLFHRSGGMWSEVDRLTGSDAAADDRFGWAVAIDGDYAVVGAPGDDANGLDSGSAYVFRRDGVRWVQTAKLPPEPVVASGVGVSSVGAGDQFGYSVGISGNYVVVGAPGEDTAGLNSGAAYVFVRCTLGPQCAEPWGDLGALARSDAAAEDRFGHAVGISGDYLVVGAPLHEDDRDGLAHAYIYERSVDTWLRAATFEASGRLGVSVAIDGEYALVGADQDDENGLESGSAFVLQRVGDNWLSFDKLTSIGREDYEHFGRSVAIRDGYAVVGAQTATSYGAAYVFQSSEGSWRQTNRIAASDGAAGDVFGASVAVSGNYLLVGAHGDDDKGQTSGSAYVFTK